MAIGACLFGAAWVKLCACTRCLLSWCFTCGLCTALPRQDQLERTVEQLRQHGCMDYTTVVAATGDRCEARRAARVQL